MGKDTMGKDHPATESLKYPEEKSLLLYHHKTSHTLLSTDSTLMAHRSKLQTLYYVLASDCLGHLLFILALFIYTLKEYYKHDEDWLFHNPSDPWFQVYVTACTNLRVQTIMFCAVFFARFIYDAHHAEYRDGIWIRQEESVSVRRAACIATWFNIIVCSAWIYLQLFWSNIDNWRNAFERVGNRPAGQLGAQSQLIDWPQH